MSGNLPNTSISHLENYIEPHSYFDEMTFGDFSGVRYRLVMISGEPFLEVIEV